jgi:glucose-1-phosphate cytidylyltransferase
VRTIILCGGRGTRLREYTERIPKPMVEVGGRPILWHIMQIYARQGFKDFVLALGYLGDRVKKYFGESPEDWSVSFAETGEDTNTGGRIWQLRDEIREPLFLVTYGDGVADLDLRRLVEFHRSHGPVATVTVVRPQVTFGLVDVSDDGRVTRFVEKPRLDAWVNGGFFVFDRRIFDYLGPDSILEREPMERLAASGELRAYRHDGFWACMDTYKDHADLNELWSSGKAPWLATGSAPRSGSPALPR